MSEHPEILPCRNDQPHWWLVETPDGPTVKARCKRCHQWKVMSSSSYGDHNSTGAGIGKPLRVRCLSASNSMNRRGK